MLPYLEQQVAPAQCKPWTYKKIHTVIGSLALYSVKDVEVVNIVKGESVPSHLLLQVVQAKMIVDEELYV